MARVVIEQLVKVYPDKSGTGLRAVDRVDLSVEDGECMVLVGPSGCGKSTTLRMIAGLEEITSGTVKIDGRAVNDLLPSERDIGMVFQNYALYPHMTVRENLLFGLRLRRLPTAEMEKRLRETAALLGLDTLLDRRPKALSGGQRQRVALGRAIVRHPKVLLFDEPLSNLDAQMRASTRAEIARLHSRLGATMIYVTHDQVEAMTLGNRICVMHSGVVQQVAAPLELYQRPANLFVAGFLGQPPMNLIHGRIVDGGQFPAFAEEPAKGEPLRVALGPTLSALGAAHKGKPVVLGIRPEDIHDARSPACPADSPAASLPTELVEPMGAETLLHLRTGYHTLVARLRGDTMIGQDRTFTVRFAMDRAHLFDPSTGLVLR
jgi:multiple sugar transport system ATP-binding protein